MNQELHVASMQCMCEVRPPKPSDYEKMADLAGQLGYERTGAQVQARIDGMRDLNEYAVYVAELPGGQIAGWFGVYTFRAVALDRFAETSGLVVDQQIRSRGIGKALLAIAEQWARTRACPTISVRSNVTRDRAHWFYPRNGYEHIKTQKLFQKQL
ncbi:MAG TPA: GNAT family N-acetyltransferase [Candidatus Acidoferrum sp.]|nr:GNAT family N-acetyltransferase [Candidatus Acidoferrum sp.]